MSYGLGAFAREHTGFRRRNLFIIPTYTAEFEVERGVLVDASSTEDDDEQDE